MLTIYGKSQRFCDGVSHAQFYENRGDRPGGAVSFPEILRAEAVAGTPKFAQGFVIMALPARRALPTSGLCSTPSPKRQATFAATSTRSRPTSRASRSASTCRNWAQMMDKLVLLRSASSGLEGQHDAFQCLTGRVASAICRRAGGRRSGRASRNCRGCGRPGCAALCESERAEPNDR